MNMLTNYCFDFNNKGIGGNKQTQNWGNQGNNPCCCSPNAAQWLYRIVELYFVRRWTRMACRLHALHMIFIPFVPGTRVTGVPIRIWYSLKTSSVTATSAFTARLSSTRWIWYYAFARSITPVYLNRSRPISDSCPPSFVSFSDKNRNHIVHDVYRCTLLPDSERCKCCRLFSSRPAPKANPFIGGPGTHRCRTTSIHILLHRCTAAGSTPLTRV